jgi:hypothetical protein
LTGHQDPIYFETWLGLDVGLTGHQDDLMDFARFNYIVEKLFATMRGKVTRIKNFYIVIVAVKKLGEIKV